MNSDEFEQELQRRPFRPVPPEWRADILAASRVGARRIKAEPASCAGGNADRQTEPAPNVVSLGSWSEWFWPCPQAWVGLAAVWMVLIGLRVSTPSTSATLARRTSSERELALAAQRRELARLLDGQVEPAPAAKAPVPGPRTERISPSKV
jgi:hypothetical protein